MRKRTCIAVSMALCLLLTGCSSGSKAETNEAEEATVVQAETRKAEKTTVEQTQRQSDAAPENSEPQESGEPRESSYPVFNFDTKTVTLNSGHEMPILGLGMFSLSDSEAENSTYWALKAGFRLIDTARIYGNEEAVGKGLRRAIDEGIVTREDVFITTKMWTSDFDNGDAAIDASLDRLGVDYIDLMILHHSQPSNDVDAYQAMRSFLQLVLSL